MEALDLFCSPAPSCHWKLHLSVLLFAMVEQHTRANTEVSEICTIVANILDAIVAGMCWAILVQDEIVSCSTRQNVPRETEGSKLSRFFSFNICMKDQI